MANDELNQLIKVAREAAFFIRSIDGYENSKIANELSTLANKVEKQKLLAIGRLAARVVMRNSRKAVEQCVEQTACRLGENAAHIGPFLVTPEGLSKCDSCGCTW